MSDVRDLFENRTATGESPRRIGRRMARAFCVVTGVAHRNQRVTTYDVVRIIVGVVLVTAAGLKAHELATLRVAETALFTNRWVLLFITQIELLTGLWLCINIHASWARRFAIAIFLAFALVSLSRAFRGELSCGCFGNVTVHPWLTAVFDSVAFISLATSKPRSSRPSPCVASLLAIAFPLALPIGIAMAVYPSTPYAAGNDMETGDASGTMVLDPWRWIGGRFPLVRHMDIGEKLSQGDWELLFYRRNCPECRKAIGHYARVMRTIAPIRPQPAVSRKLL